MCIVTQHVLASIDRSREAAITLHSNRNDQKQQLRMLASTSPQTLTLLLLHRSAFCRLWPSGHVRSSLGAFAWS